MADTTKTQTTGSAKKLTPNEKAFELLKENGDLKAQVAALQARLYGTTQPTPTPAAATPPVPPAPAQSTPSQTKPTAPQQKRSWVRLLVAAVSAIALAAIVLGTWQLYLYTSGNKQQVAGQPEAKVVEPKGGETQPADAAKVTDDSTPPADEKVEAEKPVQPAQTCDLSCIAARLEMSCGEWNFKYEGVIVNGVNAEDINVLVESSKEKCRGKKKVEEPKPVKKATVSKKKNSVRKKPTPPVEIKTPKTPCDDACEEYKRLKAEEATPISYSSAVTCSYVLVNNKQPIVLKTAGGRVVASWSKSKINWERTDYGWVGEVCTNASAYTEAGNGARYCGEIAQSEISRSERKRLASGGNWDPNDPFCIKSQAECRAHGLSWK